MNKWFTGLERIWFKFVIELDSLFVGGNRVAVAWYTWAFSKSAKEAAFTGINVFSFDGGGAYPSTGGVLGFPRDDVPDFMIRNQVVPGRMLDVK